MGFHREAHMRARPELSPPRAGRTGAPARRTPGWSGCARATPGPPGRSPSRRRSEAFRRPRRRESRRARSRRRATRPAPSRFPRFALHPGGRVDIATSAVAARAPPASSAAARSPRGSAGPRWCAERAGGRGLRRTWMTTPTCKQAVHGFLRRAVVHLPRNHEDTRAARTHRIHYNTMFRYTILGRTYAPVSPLK